VVLCGNSNGKAVVIWCGRIHRYEGYKTYELNIIALLSALLGCKYLIATNASGGGQIEMEAGCIMLINSFLNRAGSCPLKFLHGEGLSDDSIFNTDSVLQEEDLNLVRECAKAKDLKLYEGSYNWAPGPNYESHLETKIGIEHKIGAFGMSTVYELITAKKLGIRLIAISMIANKASVLCTEALTHKEVLEKMELCVPKVKVLLEELLQRITIPKEEVDVFKVLPKYENQLIVTPIYYKMPSLEAAKDFLGEVIKKINKGKAIVTYAINLMTDKMSLESSFVEYTEVPYKSLPNVPTFTNASQELIFGFGRVSTEEVIMVIHNFSKISTSPIESKVIGELIKSTKCSFVLSLVRAFSSKCGKEELMIVKDTMNLSNVDTMEYKHISFNPELRKKLNGIILEGMSSKLEANLAGVDSPALPTLPEREIIERSGMEWFALSDFSLIDRIRMERIPFAILGMCHDLKGAANIKLDSLKDYLFKTFNTVTIKKLLEEVQKSVIKGASIDAKIRLHSSADELQSLKEIKVKLEV
jgi:purine-nucleoside phosphorylase